VRARGGAFAPGNLAPQRSDDQRSTRSARKTIVKRLAILISGRGSNMVAILDAIAAGKINGDAVGVISNRPDAGGLAIAAARGIPTTPLDHRTFASRVAFDAALGSAIDAMRPDLVVLAGFMRVLTPAFVEKYAGRLINIHPALLPAYPGLHTHRRVLADGGRIHGCTVHFVTAEVDHGPIVVQGAVPVLPDDDETTLAARVLAVEHRIYAAAVAWFCADRLVIEGRRVRVMNEAADADSLIVPALLQP
jgi:phosphoribosylglycinamide formyltransferase 1